MERWDHEYATHIAPRKTLEVQSTYAHDLYVFHYSLSLLGSTGVGMAGKDGRLVSV